MNVSALVLAHQPQPDLRPLPFHTCPALVPVAGKTLLEHSLEDLWEAGLRKVHIAIAPQDKRTPELIGNGARLGMEVNYLEVSAAAPTAEILKQLPDCDFPLCVMRADIMRTPVTRLLIARYSSGEMELPADLPVFHGCIAMQHAGLAVLNSRHADTRALDTLSEKCCTEIQHYVCALDDAVMVPMRAPNDIVRANRAVLSKEFAGISPTGRALQISGVRVGPQSSISASAYLDDQVHVGSHAIIHDDVEVSGLSAIGDRCVIDDGARIIDSLILPGSYVGRGVSLSNALVSGPWLYRCDLQQGQFIDDPLLLA